MTRRPRENPGRLLPVGLVAACFLLGGPSGCDADAGCRDDLDCVGALVCKVSTGACEPLVCKVDTDCGQGRTCDDNACL